MRGVMTRLRQLAFDRRAQLYTYALADEVLTKMPPTASAESILRIREWEKSAC